MRVSTKFPVAVHAMIMIAGLSDKQKVNSEIIAESTGINAVVIRNIFKSLKQANMIHTAPGPGGTTLARSTETISLWDIFTAVESGKANDIFAFHRHPSEACPVGSSIFELLQCHLDDAVGAMKKELSDITLARMLEELFRLNPGLPSVPEI